MTVYDRRAYLHAFPSSVFNVFFFRIIRLEYPNWSCALRFSLKMESLRDHMRTENKSVYTNGLADLGSVYAKLVD